MHRASAPALLRRRRWLSIAPLLLVVLAVASLALGDGGARDQLSALVHDSLGDRAVPLVSQLIHDARAWSGGATVIGVVFFVTDRRGSWVSSMPRFR